MFRLVFNIDNEIDNRNIYTHNINIKNEYEFKQSKNKLVIISMDFINSTENLIKNGTLKFIENTQRFHYEIINLIKSYYYPYIYIHEIVGDSFIIILNADWTFNITRYTASLAISFIIQLYKKIEDYIDIRCGIVYDKIYYGNIDHNLRFFGEAINKSSRLQSICRDKNEIFCDESFLDKLSTEKLFNINNVDIIVKKETHNLKGIGSTICNCIDVKNSHCKNNFLTSEND